MNQPFERQDIGYLLTAYADGQLAPEGVMWVEEQLDANPDLRARLKEIRHLQAGLRAAFAGGAPEFVLDLPRREALLASAANPPHKKIRFQPLLWSSLAAGIVAVVMVMGSPVLHRSMPDALATRERGEHPYLEEKSAAAPANAFFAQEGMARKSEQGADFAVATGSVDESRSLPRGGAEADGSPQRQSGVVLRGANRTKAAGRDDALAFDAQVGGVAAAPAEPQTAAPGKPLVATDALARRERNAAPYAAGEARKQVAAPKPSAPPPATTPPPAPPALAKKDSADRAGARTPGQELAKALREREDLQGAPAPAPAAAPTAAPVVVASADKPQLVLDGRSAAATRPGAAGPQTKNKEIDQVPVAPTEADVEAARPLNQLDLPIAEKSASEDEKSAEVAQGREEAVASSETGSTGAFMAIGAGQAGSGAERRARVITKRLEENEAAQEALQTAAQQALRDGKHDEADRLNEEVSRRTKENEALRGLLAKSTAKKSYRIVDITQKLASFPGPDLDIPEPGNRQTLQPIEPDVEPGVSTLIELIQRTIAPESWEKPGTGIEVYNGQLVVTNTMDVQRQVEEFLATIRRQAGIRGLTEATDSAASMAFLRSDMTATLNQPIGEALGTLGGGMVVFRFSPAAERRFEQPSQVAMQNEPVARGIVRLARSAGLQVRLDGGVVQIDEATRPLDPSDAQGYTLSAFKDLFGTSPMQAIAVDPIQTVAIDADTASYDYAKARIAAGQPVDPATIKPEHFINAMPMDYPAAQGHEAFSLYAEAAPSPFARANTAWGARTALVSIGAVAKPAAADERKPLALTLAIDCSGSMAQPGGLDRIRQGLFSFVGHLRAEDRVAIVAFGDQARVVLPATPGNDRAALTAALANLATGGATNAAEGLGLAYQLAAETAAPERESRVLLATDGGTVAGADDLLRRVTAFKDRGITLVVVGTGQTYRAGPLQDLATRGDGQHFYVGSDADAQALFTGKLLPDRLAVLAKDAKLQVTWNPQRISHARLIGYDQRRLAAKDFRNNAVDAGELSQDTQVTALFEVLLVDGGTGPLGTAAVRYHDMRRDQVRELACPLPGTILASQPSDRLRLLSCAAATAEWLQRGWWSNVHLITPEEIRAQLARCPQPIANELRAMVK